MTQSVIMTLEIDIKSTRKFVDPEILIIFIAYPRVGTRHFQKHEELHISSIGSGCRSIKRVRESYRQTM